MDRGACPHKNNLFDYLQYRYHTKIDIEVIRLLLDSQVSANAKDKNGETVLHKLSYNNNITIEIIDLLFENGIDLNAKDRSGWTFLHNTCYSKNAKMVQVIIDYIQTRLNDKNYTNVLNFICKIQPQFKERAFALLLSLKRFQTETLKTKIPKYLVYMILLLIDDARKNFLTDLINIKNNTEQNLLDLAMLHTGNEKTIEILNSLNSI